MVPELYLANKHTRSSSGNLAENCPRGSSTRARVCVEPMSTQHRAPDKGAQRERFEPTSEPRPLSSTDLDECRQPNCDVTEAADSSQRAVYAVAVRDGVLYADTPGRTLDLPHVSVLYVTADGERATTRRVPANPGELSLVNRVLIIDERELQSATEAAKRYAPVARRHPEVA